MTEGTELKAADPRPVEATRDRPVQIPDADIYEAEGAIVVLADMPGLDDKAVTVELENDVLTIRGRAPAAGPEPAQPLVREFCERDYERSFAINTEIDREHIKAQMKNGVLNVTLPKTPESRSRSRTIEISAG
jgi:HSP20 family molecular chaperone IbpA